MKNGKATKKISSDSQNFYLVFCYKNFLAHFWRKKDSFLIYRNGMKWWNVYMNAQWEIRIEIFAWNLTLNKSRWCLTVWPKILTWDSVTVWLRMWNDGHKFSIWSEKLQKFLIFKFIFLSPLKNEINFSLDLSKNFNKIFNLKWIL